MKFASMFMPPCLGALLVLFCALPARACGLKLAFGFRGQSAPRYGLEVFAETRRKKLTGEISGIFS